MKKIVLAGLFAITMMGFSQQQASAWVNTRFSVGLNWHHQAGGNNFLWGAWRNGQPPGPEAFGGFGGHHHAAPMAHPAPQGYAPMPNYPAQAYYYAPMPQATYAGQYVSPYQFASYPRPVYYYPDASYYYYYGR
ncbi:MAG: hypothetical protein HYR84_14820 [Planctomycetes bacterium]|nr:hypothetical protein [Planctomycetota bacterium]